jgi:DNA-directed RNA polymerase specialized sigma24 family protein
MFDTLISKEEIASLRKSIAQPASIHREIVIRYYFKEQTCTQISNELHLLLGTVEERLFDACKKLKMNSVFQ